MYIYINIGLTLKPTRVAAPSLRASLGRRTACGRTAQRRSQGSKRCETNVSLVWGCFLFCCSSAQNYERWL